MTKKELRQEMISILKNLPEDKKLAATNDITERAVEFIKENNYKSIGIVLPMAIEYDTWTLIDLLLERNIQVYAPKCNYADKTMNFHRLNSRDEVQSDEKNIPIPDPNQPINNEVELLVVPGLIFSPNGYRIGYGGGFYDRFLSTFKNDTVSLIFSEQIGQTIVDDYDIPVDTIITDQALFDVKSVRADEK